VLEDKAKKLLKAKQLDQHSLTPPQIGESDQSYRTKTFLIRYCEEEVELNELIMLRAEVDVEPDYLQTPFYLEAQLFFTDLQPQGGVEKWQENHSKGKFKLVQTKTFRISGMCQGILEHVQIGFTDCYNAVLQMQVQSVLVDFRFRD
jgi:hypothetical protein